MTRDTNRLLDSYISDKRDFLFFSPLTIYKGCAILSSTFSISLHFLRTYIINSWILIPESFTDAIVDWLPITRFPYFNCLPDISISMLPLVPNCIDDRLLTCAMHRPGDTYLSKYLISFWFLRGFWTAGVRFCCIFHLYIVYVPLLLF